MAVPEGSPSNPKLTKKGAATRGRIIAAAADLMFEQGVASTRMEDVRAAAGVSSSQVYHYFVDKQALVLAVIDYQDERIVGGQQPLFDKLDTLSGLQEWRDFLVEHQRLLECIGGCPIGSLGAELAEIDDAARAAVAASFERWQHGIHSGFAAMASRGELRADIDPDKLATATLATLQGGLLLAQMNRSTEPLEAALNMVIDHVGLLLSA